MQLVRLKNELKYIKQYFQLTVQSQSLKCISTTAVVHNFNMKQNLCFNHKEIIVHIVNANS